MNSKCYLYCGISAVFFILCLQVSSSKQDDGYDNHPLITKRSAFSYPWRKTLKYHSAIANGGLKNVNDLTRKNPLLKSVRSDIDNHPLITKRSPFFNLWEDALKYELELANDEVKTVNNLLHVHGESPQLKSVRKSSTHNDRYDNHRLVSKPSTTFDSQGNVLKYHSAIATDGLKNVNDIMDLTRKSPLLKSIRSGIDNHLLITKRSAFSYPWRKTLKYHSAIVNDGLKNVNDVIDLTRKNPLLKSVRSDIDNHPLITKRSAFSYPWRKTLKYPSAIVNDGLKNVNDVIDLTRKNPLLKSVRSDIGNHPLITKRSPVFNIWEDALKYGLELANDEVKTVNNLLHVHGESPQLKSVRKSSTHNDRYDNHRLVSKPSTTFDSQGNVLKYHSAIATDGLKNVNDVMDLTRKNPLLKSVRSDIDNHPLITKRSAFSYPWRKTLKYPSAIVNDNVKTVNDLLNIHRKSPQLKWARKSYSPLNDIYDNYRLISKRNAIFNPLANALRYNSELLNAVQENSPQLKWISETNRAMGYNPEISRYSLDPDARRNLTQLITSKGYPVEIYTVRTADGFLLDLHRIPHGRNNSMSTDEPKPVVFLQHGFISSACDWVMNSASDSLGFILADHGYDVWMGNSRGNTYSRKHVSLKPDDNRFWDWSFDEMAIFDTPAFIDFILSKTGQSSLHYVGHSQGTMMAFAMFAHKPEYQQKVRLFVGLAPIISLKHMISPIKYFSVLSDNLVYDILGRKDFAPNDVLMKTLASTVCESRWSYSMCANVLFLLCGPDTANLDKSRLDVYLHHTPAGASVKDLVHFSQMVRKKRFAMYDYDSPSENMKHYGQEIPPAYNVSSVSVPSVLFSAPHDWLAGPKDTEILKATLPNIKGSYDIPSWNHLDFVWGIDAAERCYDKILEWLPKF